ncbi:hypothetical protein [Vagococcus jeotgali]|uniref:hypothetical protein n=1 Tax=Vagococcus jeotgali TaxID=3109030 RepID=UPI002DD9D761|nr:hypothetical protein [Vagococcus sp. B2T-5]
MKSKFYLITSLLLLVILTGCTQKIIDLSDIPDIHGSEGVVLTPKKAEIKKDDTLAVTVDWTHHTNSPVSFNETDIIPFAEQDKEELVWEKDTSTDLDTKVQAGETKSVTLMFPLENKHDHVAISMIQHGHLITDSNFTIKFK